MMTTTTTRPPDPTVPASSAGATVPERLAFGTGPARVILPRLLPPAARVRVVSVLACDALVRREMEGGASDAEDGARSAAEPFAAQGGFDAAPLVRAVAAGVDRTPPATFDALRARDAPRAAVVAGLLAPALGLDPATDNGPPERGLQTLASFLTARLWTDRWLRFGRRCRDGFADLPRSVIESTERFEDRCRESVRIGHGVDREILGQVCAALRRATQETWSLFEASESLPLDVPAAMRPFLVAWSHDAAARLRVLEMWNFEALLATPVAPVPMHAWTLVRAVLIARYGRLEPAA